MKVTWLCHFAMVDVCEQYELQRPSSGGWLETYKNELSTNPEFELSIICVEKTKKTETVERFEKNGVSFILLRAKDCNYFARFTSFFISALNNAIDDTKPDILHIHGTEFGLPLCIKDEIRKKCRICVSIQGLISVISQRYYWGGLTFKDLTLMEYATIWYQYRNALKRGKIEEQIIKDNHYFLGRTEWDKSHLFSLNDKIHYYFTPEKMRDEFVNGESWSANAMERHTIFCGGGCRIPIKGFHQVLKAVAILKEKYADVKIKVPGDNPFASNKLRNNAGYMSYLKREILQCGLKDTIEFLGNLSAAGMAEQFRKANCYVMASSIENSSNTLLESFIVGTPSVVSHVGGVMNWTEHGRNCLLYRFEEYEMLASHVSRIFSDDGFAGAMSVNARDCMRRYMSNDSSIGNAYKKIIHD